MKASRFDWSVDTPLRVCLMHTAVSAADAPDARDVLEQLNGIEIALSRLGHVGFRLPCTLDLASLSERLLAERPQVVFNLVESLDGLDRLLHLPAWRVESLGIPLTGCPAAVLLKTTCKTAAKRRMRQAGLPTPDWVEADTVLEASCGTHRWILKSVWEHASFGLDAGSVVETDNPVIVHEALMSRRRNPGGAWFAEAFIDGREFNVSLLESPSGVQVLPLAEICFPRGDDAASRILDYAAKWDVSDPRYHATPRTFDFGAQDAGLQHRLRHLALDCWEVFGLRGAARVDFRVDADGNPWILEVNANPCLSPDAGFAAALEQHGIPFEQGVQWLLTQARTPRKEASEDPRGVLAVPRLETFGTIRTVPSAGEAGRIRDLVRGTGYFSESEVDVAVELVTDRISRGEASDYHFILVGDPDHLLGYACYGRIPCTASSFDLYWIAVARSKQGRGLGLSLMVAVENHVGLLGGKRIYIETSNRPQYAATRGFYRRCGYRLVSLLEDFYGPGDDRALFLRRV